MDKKVLISYLNGQIAICNKHIKTSEDNKTRIYYRGKKTGFQKTLEFVHSESEILVSPPLEFYKDE